MHRPPLDQRRQHSRGRASLPSFRWSCVAPKAVTARRPPPRSRRIVWPCPAMLQVQRVPQGGKSPLPAGRRDVERPPGGQLHARGHAMQLHPANLGVLRRTQEMSNWSASRPAKAKASKASIAASCLACRLACPLGRKGQHPMRVGPLPPDAVDQLPASAPGRPALPPAGNAPDLALRIDQVAAHRSPPPRPPLVNLISISCHPAGRPAYALPEAPQDPGRSRSAVTAARLPPPPAHAGSRPAQVGRGCSGSAPALAAVPGHRRRLSARPQPQAAQGCPDQLRQRHAPARRQCLPARSARRAGPQLDPAGRLGSSGRIIGHQQAQRGCRGIALAGVRG